MYKVCILSFFVSLRVEVRYMKKNLLTVTLCVAFLFSACKSSESRSVVSDTTTVASYETTEGSSEETEKTETTEESTSLSSQSSETTQPVSVPFAKNTTLSYIEYSIESHDRFICGERTVRFSYDELKVDEKKYPELAKVLKEILDPIYADLQNEFTKLQADPPKRTGLEEDDDRYMDGYGTSIWVLRNDTKFFSFVISGGCYTIDLSKNALLSFEDIVTDEVAFRNACLDAGCLPQHIADAQRCAGKILFPDYDGVYIASDPDFYDAIKIPYFGNESMFNSACFSDLPENYLFWRDIEKDPSWTIRWDIDGDGMTENIRFDREERRDSASETLNRFTIGDTKTTMIDSDRFYDDCVPSKVFLLHVGENDFLGVYFTEIDAYESIEIYALHKDRTVEFVQCIPDLSIGGPNGGYPKCIDPTGFTASQMEYIGAEFFETGRAAFDETGRFAFQDTVLELGTVWILYAQNEMTVTRVDPDTRESIGKYKLKPTEQVVFVETDKETYVMMQTITSEPGDSVYFRLKLTKEGDYEYLYEGKDIDDLFRNVFHGC